jgi:hypothetical protein
MSPEVSRRHSNKLKALAKISLYKSGDYIGKAITIIEVKPILYGH